MTNVGNTPGRVPRTLAEDLRARDDDALSHLLLARPDLARPAPVDMTQLASRVGDQASVRQMVALLDSLQLMVLLAVSGLDPPVALESVARAVATEQASVEQASVERASVERAVDSLKQLALVWGSGSSLQLVRAVRQVLAPMRADGVVLTAEPPELAGDRADPAVVDATAAGTAADVVRQVEALLDAWRERPPAVLRSSGGVGVREVRVVAARLDITEAQAGFLIELAAITGLLTRAGDVRNDVWLPTAAADAWPDRAVAARWRELATAWLATPRAAHLVGQRDERDRVTNALSPGLEQSSTVDLRRLTVSALAQARPRRSDEDAVVAWVAWHRPRRTLARDRMVRASLSEAGWLGLTALGVLSQSGAELLAGRDPAPVLEPLLPARVDSVVLQADLTAIAPGPLHRNLAVTLSLLGDVESRGGATVYRFSASSIRRALDTGWPAEQVHTFLAAHSSTPVPQPLTYLVDDVARRHGRLRVGSLRSYLRSDDVTEIDALVADAALADLGLNRIAPTVVVTSCAAHVVLDRLREGGHAPVSESPERSEPRRSAARRGSTSRRPLLPQRVVMSALEAQAVVAAVRAGDRAAAQRPPDSGRHRVESALEMQAALREAAHSGSSVWLAYMDQAGSLSERIVDPLRVDAGWLTAHDHRTDRTQGFALHRIRRVSRLL